jgi:GT2 family glycosyltransferase
MLNVDFLICNYNTKKILDSCIKSILNLSNSDLTFNIYIYDNNSNDESLEILNQYKLNKNIKIFYGNKNIGYGRAINFIFDKSISENIIILNPDTILDFNTYQLQKVIDNLQLNEIVGFQILNPSGTIQEHINVEPGLFWLFSSVIRKGYPFIFNYFHKFYFKFLSSNLNKKDLYISGCALLMKRNSFIDLGKFNEKYFLYFEDTELFKTANALKYKIHTSDLKIIHNSSYSVKNSNFKIKTQIYKSALIYYKSNFKIYKYFIAKVLLFISSFLCLLNPFNFFFKNKLKYFTELIKLSFYLKISI